MTKTTSSQSCCFLLSCSSVSLSASQPAIRPYILASGYLEFINELRGNGWSTTAQLKGTSLLCHHNVDVVSMEDPTKLFQECFVSGNVAHLMTKDGGGGGGNRSQRTKSEIIIWFFVWIIIIGIIVFDPSAIWTSMSNKNV